MDIKQVKERKLVKSRVELVRELKLNWENWSLQNPNSFYMCVSFKVYNFFEEIISNPLPIFSQKFSHKTLTDKIKLKIIVVMMRVMIIFRRVQVDLVAHFGI